MLIISCQWDKLSVALTLVTVFINTCCKPGLLQNSPISPRRRVCRVRTVVVCLFSTRKSHNREGAKREGAKVTTETANVRPIPIL